MCLHICCGLSVLEIGALVLSYYFPLFLLSSSCPLPTTYHHNSRLVVSWDLNNALKGTTELGYVHKIPDKGSCGVGRSSHLAFG